MPSLNLIDWGNLLANTAWIVACAMALALFSYASWEASQRGEKLRDRLAQPGKQIALGLAGLLFSAGVAGAARTPLELAAWTVTGLVCLAWTIQCWLKLRAARKL
ncbi:MAG: hypothetical protein PHS96_00490 [Anaerolineales bacterium]|nr:hypothetical protein [Anaerolineales bacterium]